ncbi:hypothetical protein BDC45DRAFT_556026 [Circinella umbellata]|nr:hypothetical protein BDC45DRAFT_556026 [Circinella umbellata]
MYIKKKIKNQILTSNAFFFNQFPFDVVTKIFSHLNQSECLTCMATCQSWYKELPQYTQDTVWTKLSISSVRMPPQNNQRWQLCVGKHVTHVEFQGFNNEQNLYLALSHIFEFNCQHIESLEFSGCVIPSQYVLLSILKTLETTLKKLVFNNHGADLNFLDVLKLYPNLTYFSFSQITRRGPLTSDNGRRELLASSSSSSPATNDKSNNININIDNDNFVFENLTHLFMNNNTIRMQNRLVPILQKCPNLRYLAFGNAQQSPFEYLPSSKDAYIDPQLIFFWCPHLIYLEVYNLRYSEYRKMAIDHLQQNHQQSYNNSKSTLITRADISLPANNNYNGLRSLIVYESDPYYLPETINNTCFFENTNTLEFLVLGRCFQSRTSGNWGPILQNIGILPVLHTLVLDDIVYYHDGDSLDSINMMLAQCPTLEVLILHDTGSRVKQPCVNLPAVLSCLKQLKRLDLNNIDFTWDYVINNDEEREVDTTNATSTSTLITSIISQEQQFFEQLANNNSKINKIRFNGSSPVLTDELILGFACLPSLKELFLGTFNNYTKEGFYRFSEMLHKRNSCIETLEAKGLQGDCISDSTLYILGKLPHIQRIHLSGASTHILEINSAAVIKLLLCNVYASRSLRSLYLGYMVFSDMINNHNHKKKVDPVELLESKLSHHYDVIRLAHNFNFYSLGIAYRNRK